MSTLFSGKLQQLVKIARQQNKEAFVDPAAAGGAPPMDPAMAGGAPPMDPAMAGGAPPMDPAMMDPSMMGMPPMDPSMMAPPAPVEGGGEDIRAIIKEELAASGLTGASSASQEPTGQIKPKIDVNVELLQIKKMLARLSDALGINIPAADMVATSEDLTEMAGGGPAPAPEAAAGGIDPIAPMEGFPGAPKAAELGESLDTLSDRASAMAFVMSRK
jgi:hypothetical protein